MKTKKTTLFFFLFVCIISQAQEDKKLNFGISVFPNYSFETAEYKLSTKSVIGFGLGYQNNGQRTKKTEARAFNMVDDPVLPNEFRFIDNHHNLEIPLYYKHNIGKQFYVFFGTSGIINLSNVSTIILYFDDSKERETQRETNNDIVRFRRFNFYGDLGVGIDYLKKENYTLFVHPYVQYGFLGISQEASLNRKILSIGLTAGMKI